MQALNTKASSIIAPGTLAQRSSVKSAAAAFKSAKAFNQKYAAPTARRVTMKAVVAAAPASAAPASSSQTDRPLNIVFISTEVAPWSKTGKLLALVDRALFSGPFLRG